jgi:hypothetical protein
MSLETAIQENTNAIRELIAAIKSGVPTSAAQVAAVVEQGKTETAKTEKATNEKKSDAKTASSQPGAKQQSEAPKADAQGKVEEKKGDAGSGDDAPTYQEAAAAVTKLAAAKGKPAAIAVIGQFDKKEGDGKATKLPDVKPEDYAAVIAACDKALEAVEA